jgi:two-component system, OmpR family, sensor kinase
MKSSLLNKNSIFFTITIAFAISILFVTISCIVLINILNQKEHFLLKKQTTETAKTVLREHHKYRVFDTEFKQHLQQFNYFWIEDQKKKQNILNKKDLHIIIQTKLRRNRAILLDDGGRQYIAIFTEHDIFLLEDKNSYQSLQKWIVITYLFIFSLLVFLYAIIYKKLKPVHKLHKNIQKLSREDFDIEIPSTHSKDEISLLFQEFYESATKLKNIKESRNIFIRNIMHELKTPITKGKLLNALENTAENKEKMQDIFLRLESLITEFASIEELLSTNKKLNKKEYFLEDIIDESVDILLVDKKVLNKQYDQNIKIKIDFKLFSIAIKNLIDNGLKYSSDHKVTIKYEAENIQVENKGDILKYPLEKYFEPFFKGNDNSSKESFGLGLYIVYNILQVHAMKLVYRHKDGINIFTIKPL